MFGTRRLTCTVMLAASLLPLFAAVPLAAQSWPTRPVKFMLTLGPGSGADIGARLLADRLTKKWDQPIVIENRPGGDGIVAINAFVSARDDHVLLFAPSSSFIGHPYQHRICRTNRMISPLSRACPIPWSESRCPWTCPSRR